MFHCWKSDKMMAPEVLANVSVELVRAWLQLTVVYHVLANVMVYLVKVLQQLILACHVFANIIRQ